MEKTEKHYGLTTAITMIVGICIGSGIFFKADSILAMTGGSVPLGVLVLSLGAFSIIFGSISLTEMSVRTNKNGGIIAYFEDFISPQWANGFGWFQTFLYMPSINVVVSWAAGIYTLIFLNLPNTLEMQVLIGTFYLVFFYVLNFVSLNLGGKFQIITTYVKLVPLIGIALVGLFWTKEVPPLAEGMVAVPRTDVGWGWLAALVPVAFSYDGWPIATTITNEIGDAKRKMPIALTVGPLIVLAVYVTYFLGLTTILGPDYVLSAGNRAVYAVGEVLLGANGGQIITLFVIISVLGVVNGVTLGTLRLPQALATKGMIPGSAEIAQIDEKRQLSVGSFKVSLTTALLWMVVHYFTQKTGILKSGDISEIAIVFGYICYLVLFVKTMMMYRQGEIKSIFKGLVAPILAIFGSLIIVVGGLISNPFYGSISLLICFFFCLAGFSYYSYAARRKQDTSDVSAD